LAGRSGSPAGVEVRHKISTQDSKRRTVKIVHKKTCRPRQKNIVKRRKKRGGKRNTTDEKRGCSEVRETGGGRRDKEGGGHRCAQFLVYRRRHQKPTASRWSRQQSVRNGGKALNPSRCIPITSAEKRERTHPARSSRGWLPGQKEVQAPCLSQSSEQGAGKGVFS